jgi:hypothetical protein
MLLRTQTPNDAFMEARLAGLEEIVVSTRAVLKEICDDIRSDIRDLRNELRSEVKAIRDRQDADLRLVFGALFAVALGLAKGFRWL